MKSLEYLAGILEVAGSLIITQPKDRLGPRALLLIQHQNRTLPDLFAERFGGKVIFSTVSSGPRWHWSKQGKSAQAVLRELRPFISVRILDFDRILGLELRNRGGSPGYGKRGRLQPEKSVGAELQRLAA